MSSVDESQIVPSGGSPAAPSVRIEAPADYEELRAFRQNFKEKIEPFWDDVRPLLEDEEERNFYRSSREALAEQRKRLEPTIDPVLQPVVKHFEEKWSPVVEYVNELRTERETAAATKKSEEESAQKAAFAANKAYAERIMAERADFRNADGYPSPMMEDLIILAAQRRMSIEDAYKEYGPKYFGVKPAAVPREERKPPTSLRGDAATPGVPGESRAEKPTTQKERLARMRANMIAAGGRGA